jgi:hypothetical protein
LREAAESERVAHSRDALLFHLEMLTLGYRLCIEDKTIYVHLHRKGFYWASLPFDYADDPTIDLEERIAQARLTHNEMFRGDWELR